MMMFLFVLVLLAPSLQDSLWLWMPLVFIISKVVWEAMARVRNSPDIFSLKESEFLHMFVSFVAVFFASLTATLLYTLCDRVFQNIMEPGLWVVCMSNIISYVSLCFIYPLYVEILRVGRN